MTKASDDDFFVKNYFEDEFFESLEAILFTKIDSEKSCFENVIKSVRDYFFKKLYKSSGGNLVDSLPPAASTAATQS